MSLPQLIVVTEGRLARIAGRSLPETVSEAATGGAKAFLFREKYLDRRERLRLGSQIAESLEDDATLIVASDSDLAESVGATGVHLSNTDPPVDDDWLVGRSCHDASELAAFVDEVDYVTLSPVYPSISKPGYGPGFGLGGFARLCSTFPRPVFALGGVRPGNAAEMMVAGAYGVAVAGAVMAADDPASVVAALLAELGETP